MDSSNLRVGLIFLLGLAKELGGAYWGGKSDVTSSPTGLAASKSEVGGVAYDGPGL